VACQPHAASEHGSGVMASAKAMRAATAETVNGPQGDRLTGSISQPDNGLPHPKQALLEKSPFEIDGGELVGRRPEDVPSELLVLKFRAQNPLKAFREKCLDCCCGNATEVRKCVAVDCALWPFRMGTNPFRKRREFSPEQKRSLAERLRTNSNTISPIALITSGGEIDD
jgi:hypothetical protein